MIVSRAVVSDDRVLPFLVLVELLKQRFALVRSLPPVTAAL